MCFKQVKNLEMRTGYDSDFFVTESPLVQINLNLLTDSVLDSMHLVYMGVTKRFLSLLLTNVANHKLSDTNLQAIDNKVKRFSKFAPVEFARKIRSVSFFSGYWS